MANRRWIGLVLLAGVISMACGKGRGDSAGGAGSAGGKDGRDRPETTVMVLAAASTRDAVETIGRAYLAAHGVKVVVSAGGSNMLAKQIIDGAPADLFLSASVEWAEAVKGKIPVADDTPLLTNDLVLIVPAANPAGVRGVDDLGAGAVKQLALAGENVPAGIYARKALERINAYGPLMAAKQIVRGQDVRATLAFVQRGEVDAGIVYATDAMAAGEAVRVIHTFEPLPGDRITYPLLLLSARDKNPAAGAFYDYLKGPEAKKIFVQAGFRQQVGNGK